jgi:hypothetical protein
MNNIISVSGGNDSIAMLLVIDRLLKQDPDFFKNETWHAVYFNTHCGYFFPQSGMNWG